MLHNDPYMFKKRENVKEIEEGSLLSPKFDNDGLIPVITMCDKTKEILMHGYMNVEALKKTIETKEAHYWSRSRKEIWHKGRWLAAILAVIVSIWYFSSEIGWFFGVIFSSIWDFFLYINIGGALKWLAVGFYQIFFEPIPWVYNATSDFIGQYTTFFAHAGRSCEIVGEGEAAKKDDKGKDQGSEKKQAGDKKPAAEKKQEKK